MTAPALLTSLCLILALVSFGVYAHVRRWGFDRSRGVSISMQVMGASATVLAILMLWAIGTTTASGIQRAAGAAVMAAGLGLFVWTRSAAAGHVLALAFSEHSPPQLLDHGPWRWIRHPHYAAYALTWAGAAVASGRWLAVCGAGYMVAWYVAAALQEESLIARSPLGPGYRRYKRSTGMFIPRLWRSPDADIRRA